MLIHSFDPVVGPVPRVLILGSMPGRASLAASEYYAHPRNDFWRIMSDLGYCEHRAEYVARLQSLRDSRIALWDVLAACNREGSLDARIVRETEQPHDLLGLLDEHATIAAIFFNGRKAEQAFHSHSAPGLPSERREHLALHRLPSTSPAYAIPYERKLESWSAIDRFLRPSGSSRRVI